MTERVHAGPSGLRDRVGDWIESAGPRNFIIVLIIVNAIILGIETSENVMRSAVAPWLIGANRLILAVFVAEIAIKLFAFGPRFFRSGWNMFDFLVVGVSLVPMTGPLEILRSLRILRVLRLLSQVERLRQIIESLLRALPGMGWTALLLVLVFYVFAVMGTQLFGASFPEWFGTLGDSLFSLFQVMTLESWSTGIARPVMEAYPWAWTYFVPFILVSSFMVLNLFIAIIVSATQSLHADEEAQYRDRLMAQLAAIDARLERMEQARPQP